MLRCVRPALLDLKRTIDYAETGGALLAGVHGVVVICHGRSNQTAMKNAIRNARQFVEQSLVAQLQGAIERHREVWATQDETEESQEEDGGSRSSTTDPSSSLQASACSDQSMQGMAS